MNAVLYPLWTIVFLTGAPEPEAKPDRREAAPSLRTTWNVHTEPGLDMALFIGPLSGDPLAQLRKLYEEDRAWAQSRLSKPARQALQTIDRVVRVQGESIVTAFLALFFSAGPAKTLDQVIQSAAHPAPLLDRLEGSLNWRKDDSDRIRKIAPSLSTVLVALKAMDFEQRYMRSAQKRAAARVPSLRQYLERFDPIPWQEKWLGRKLQPEIEVLVLTYNLPYGIRIVGQRFITHYHYPNETTLHTAVHEIFHPPFDEDNQALWAALAPLKQDPWMKNIVESHDPAFGYRSFEGLVNEDSTRALDQLVSEQLGIAKDMGARVRRDDGGMHVLSAALYALMKRTKFAETGGRYETWLLETARAGHLSPDAVRQAVQAIAGPKAVDRWQPQESPPPSDLEP